MAIDIPSRLTASDVLRTGSSAASGDSPAEGSSSSSRLGSTISAIAMARIWRSPPDSARARHAGACAQDGESLEHRSSILRRAACRIDIAAHLQVLAHRHGRERYSAPAAHRRRRAADVARRAAADGFAVQSRCCRAPGLQQSGDGLEQRRFAGAVRADDADDLARVDREIDTLQHLVGSAVADDQVLDAGAGS